MFAATKEGRVFVHACFLCFVLELNWINIIWKAR